MTKEEYARYLTTAKWKRIAASCKYQAGYRCALCDFVGVDDTGLHAHHRDYARVGNELPTDLTCLCAACHKYYSKRKVIEAELKVVDKMKDELATVLGHASSAVVDTMKQISTALDTVRESQLKTFVPEPYITKPVILHDYETSGIPDDFETAPEGTMHTLVGALSDVNEHTTDGNGNMAFANLSDGSKVAKLVFFGVAWAGRSPDELNGKRVEVMGVTKVHRGITQLTVGTCTII